MTLYKKFGISSEPHRIPTPVAFGDGHDAPKQGNFYVTQDIPVVQVNDTNCTGITKLLSIITLYEVMKIAATDGQGMEITCAQSVSSDVQL